MKHHQSHRFQRSREHVKLNLCGDANIGGGTPQGDDLEDETQITKDEKESMGGDKHGHVYVYKTVYGYELVQL